MSEADKHEVENLRKLLEMEEKQKVDTAAHVLTKLNRGEIKVMIKGYPNLTGLLCRVLREKDSE